MTDQQAMPLSAISYSKTFDISKQLQACNRYYLHLPQCTFAKRAYDVKGRKAYNQHIP